MAREIMANKAKVERLDIGKISVVAVIFLILGIWIGAWWWASAPPQFIKGLTTQPLADIFSSVNALFAGLACAGVLITIYIQMRELVVTADDLKLTAAANAASALAISDTAKANGEMAKASLKMAVHSDEKSILDLFQIYCSDYFQGVKNSSMSVLIPCVASKAYFEFVVSRFFVAEQLKFPQEAWESIAKVTYSKTYEDFVAEEQNNRYKLDELINFFTLLTGRENASEIIRRCDFSYSWWRPLFWMIASGQKHRYDAHPVIQTYATTLYFPDVVRKLDKIYGFPPFATDLAMWEFIVNHPKIKSYGMDKLHEADRIS